MACPSQDARRHRPIDSSTARRAAHLDPHATSTTHASHQRSKRRLVPRAPPHARPSRDVNDRARPGNGKDGATVSQRAVAAATPRLRFRGRTGESAWWSTSNQFDGAAPDSPSHSHSPRPLAAVASCTGPAPPACCRWTTHGILERVGLLLPSPPAPTSRWGLYSPLPAHERSVDEGDR